MKKFTFLFIVFLMVSINLNYAQDALSMQEGTIVDEIAPSEFRNYEESVLVMPAFRAIGTKNG